MKFIEIFTLLIVAFSGYTSAQRCPGGPRNPNCTDARNVGRRGVGCIPPRTMWYFDVRTRQCREMRYLGCFGNNNRWCSRADCERMCRR